LFMVRRMSLVRLMSAFLALSRHRAFSLFSTLRQIVTISLPAFFVMVLCVT